MIGPTHHDSDRDDEDTYKTPWFLSQGVHITESLISPVLFSFHFALVVLGFSSTTAYISFVSFHRPPKKTNKNGSFDQRRRRRRIIQDTEVQYNQLKQRHHLPHHEEHVVKLWVIAV